MLPIYPLHAFIIIPTLLYRIYLAYYNIGNPVYIYVLLYRLVLVYYIT